MHALVDIDDSNVLIIGCPASGKTYISNLLGKDNPGHTLIHTDDYIKHGYEEALYVLLDDLKEIHNPAIIEGVLGYRLLRKGVELDCYYPDIVIELDISEALMFKTYSKERREKQISNLRGFNKSHQTILDKYKRMINKKPPKWIHVHNAY